VEKISHIAQERAKRTTIHGPEGLADLIMSGSAHNTDPSRPFTGQPHTDQGERGKQELSGIRMRDVADCLVRSYVRAAGSDLLNDKTDNNTLTYNDVYEIDFDKIDPITVVQNLTCEIEKMMGIFPNIPGQKEKP